MSIVLAAEGGFNPLAVEPGLYVWTTIAFLTVFFALAKFVFPKLQEGLADRERKVRDEIKAAESTRQEAEKILADYKARVAAAREETSGMIEEARAAADKVRQELIARAEGDARLIVDKARRQLAGERERILGELEGSLAEWSTNIAAQIVRKELTPDSHKELVENFIADVRKSEAAAP
ncbi:MAG TPA: F0F1 ATP synthase subunit B [Actinomycetota bacterium]|nr:F0F1 ATP synthase subunit B [Actinomycetota bacterium]